MPDFAAAWESSLPEIRNGVTGVGVWTALNSAIPVAWEDGTFVIGLPLESSDLAGHLKLANTKITIERAMSLALGEQITLRVIEGATLADWETAKRRDIESQRLQEQALARAKAEMEARSNWETIYDQIGRKFAAISNKSMPQSRAMFYREAVEIMVEARRSQTHHDELSERNYARCLERVSQYSEVPSVLVALAVMDRTGE